MVHAHRQSVGVREQLAGTRRLDLAIGLQVEGLSDGAVLLHKNIGTTAFWPAGSPLMDLLTIAYRSAVLDPLDLMVTWFSTLMLMVEMSAVQLVLSTSMTIWTSSPGA